MTETPSITITCAGCSTSRAVKPTSKGEPRAPTGWKKLGDATYCPLCWRKKYILRAITHAGCVAAQDGIHANTVRRSVRGFVLTALSRVREQQGLGTRQHKFRFKNKLLSLDSTTISLCLSLFPWATFRRAKAGVKAHVLLFHDDYLPASVLLTEAKRSDVKLADSFRLNPGTIVAIDRGYIDYALFARWSMAPAVLTTRSRVS